ncbi:PREDICTED: formin-like protein 18 [Erythranthe guttata]|nr:PREDICTED: formin-like protein 18 [Erythranthe guttata]|eukprot:XP_012846330.1 PREDICTED: formin-like protein 18 [Erythranthe guttata]
MDHHHHHHHGRREEEQHRPPPPRPSPPPFYGVNQPPPPFPPPPQVHHTSHTGPGPQSYPPPPPPSAFAGHPPPPPPGGGNHQHHHPHMPHFPPVINHHTDHHKDDDEFANKPSFRMYSKAEPNYSLTIRDGKVVLARSNSSDPCQPAHETSTRVKDEEGYPSFALINKATKQAIKHSIAATQPVQLTAYNPKTLDESILWTESKDLGDSYRTIRMVNNIKLNIDAFNGDKNHGGVHDGTTVVLWEWKKGDNQRWKIVPY